MREEGAAQASKPSPVKTLPPLEAPAIFRGGTGRAEREARAALRGSTTIARRRPMAPAGQFWFVPGFPR